MLLVNSIQDECQQSLVKCPQCGSEVNHANRVFSKEIYNGEIDCDVKSKLSPTVYFNASDSERRNIQTNPMNGRCWSGIDLFYLGCGTVLTQLIFCSGRLAKFLIENKLGPVSLVQYPVDGSEGNEEELKQLIAIAYGEPYFTE